MKKIKVTTPAGVSMYIPEGNRGYYKSLKGYTVEDVEEQEIPVKDPNAEKVLRLEAEKQDLTAKLEAANTEKQDLTAKLEAVSAEKQDLSRKNEDLAREVGEAHIRETKLQEKIDSLSKKAAKAN